MCAEHLGAAGIPTPSSFNPEVFGDVPNLEDSRSLVPHFPQHLAFAVLLSVCVCVCVSVSLWEAAGCEVNLDDLRWGSKHSGPYVSLLKEAE